MWLRAFCCCRKPGTEDAGARRGARRRRGSLRTATGLELLSVVVVEVEPERAGAQPKPWFSISLDYRKLESGTKRTSPRASSGKCDRRAVTGSEQNRRAEHRCDEALSAERQRTAELQTKHHTAATCTNASARISAHPRGISKPRAFPLPTSFSRLYVHLRASARRRRVLSDQGRGRTGLSGAFVVTACVSQQRARSRFQ